MVLGVLCAGGLSWSVAKGLTPWRGGAGAGSAGSRGVVGDTRAGAAREERPADIAVRIDINSAGAKELELLPGIGPALAERIIAERERGGPFKRVDDLVRVNGIGPRTVERLRGRAGVSGNEDADGK